MSSRASDRVQKEINDFNETLRNSPVILEHASNSEILETIRSKVRSAYRSRGIDSRLIDQICESVHFAPNNDKVIEWDPPNLMDSVI